MVNIGFVQLLFLTQILGVFTAGALNENGGKAASKGNIGPAEQAGNSAQRAPSSGTAYANSENMGSGNGGNSRQQSSVTGEQQGKPTNGKQLRGTSGKTSSSAEHAGKPSSTGKGGEGQDPSKSMTTSGMGTNVRSTNSQAAGSAANTAHSSKNTNAPNTGRSTQKSGPKGTSSQAADSAANTVQSRPRNTNSQVSTSAQDTGHSSAETTSSQGASSLMASPSLHVMSSESCSSVTILVCHIVEGLLTKTLYTGYIRRLFNFLIKVHTSK